MVLPASQRVVGTHTAKFTATVSKIEMENFSYQWRHDGKDINDETSNTLTITSVTMDDGGNYECVVKNERGDCVASNISELSKSIYLESNYGINFHDRNHT